MDRPSDTYDINNNDPVTHEDLTPSAEVLLKSLPPGGGVAAIPYVQEFSAFINALSKTYLNPDQGYQINREDCVRMRNSLVIMEPFKSRCMATAHLPWHIEMPDNHDKEQARIANKLTHIIEDIPDFLQLKMWLLDSGLWTGKGGVQIRYGFDWSQGKQLVIKSWEPVSGDSLIFRWEDESVAVLVMPYSIGKGTKDFSVDETIVTDMGRAKPLSDWERKMFVLNKTNIEAGDFFHATQAGMRHGLGLRHYLFFPWRLMSDVLGMLHTFVERIALGWTIFRYQTGNVQDQAAVNKAATDLSFNNVAIIPGRQEQKWKDIERLDVQPAGVDLLLKVVSDYYGTLIRRMIIGQGNIADALAPQNSKGSETSQEAFRRIVMFDSTTLAESLTRDLLSVLMEWNFPGCPYKPKFRFNLDRKDPEEYMRSVQAFYNIGGTLDEDSVRTHLGLEKPTDDSPILRRTLTGMEQDEAKKGSVGDQLDGNDKEPDDKEDGKDGRPIKKVDAIKAAVEALGPTAKAQEIISHLEGQGIRASRSLVFNTLATLRGSTNFSKRKTDA